MKAAPAVGIIHGIECVCQLLDDESLDDTARYSRDWLLSDVAADMADRTGLRDASELVSFISDPLAKSATLAQMSKSAAIRGETVIAKRHLREAESYVTTSLSAPRASDAIAKIFSAAMNLDHADARRAVILGFRSASSNPWFARAVLVDSSSVDVIVKGLHDHL